MNEWMVFGGIALLAAFLVGVQGWREQKKQREFAKRLIREEYGTAPKEIRSRVEAAVTGSFLHAQKDFFLDDITWNDLDLELVFRRMNYARCSSGAAELYRMLRCPVAESEILRERDILAETMAGKKELRERISMALYGIGFTGKYGLEDYLDYLDHLGERSNGKHILLLCLYLPAAGFLFSEPGLGIFLLFVALIVNIVTYFKEKGELTPYLVSFAYILRMMRGAQEIEGILAKACGNGSLRAGGRAAGTKAEAGEEETTGTGESVTAEGVFLKYRNILEKDVRGLEPFKRFSGMAMSMANPAGGSGPFDILLDYLKMALHLDLMKFNQMLKIVREKDAVIREFAGAVGTLDACICIAYYRASVESWCKPELSGCLSGGTDGVSMQSGERYVGRDKKTDTNVILQAEKLYHPLLEKPVKNSIRTEKGVLVTGSNASGKSTFLKTAALGAVLAQTVCTVPAESFSAPFCRVMTSMALRDNLVGGESYFMVEIRALKRILDAASEKEKFPVLCFVDEVLRGTNTVERIAASSRILKSLTGKGVLCFAATHDIELTHLLEDAYDNYHFEESIEDGDISFNYLLKKGRAQSRNAIRLLEVMGYDKNVIKEAEAMAERFLESGEWRT